MVHRDLRHSQVFYWVWYELKGLVICLGLSSAMKGEKHNNKVMLFLYGYRTFKILVFIVEIALQHLLSRKFYHIYQVQNVERWKESARDKHDRVKTLLLPVTFVISLTEQFNVQFKAKGCNRSLKNDKYFLLLDIWCVTIRVKFLQSIPINTKLIGL